MGHPFSFPRIFDLVQSPGSSHPKPIHITRMSFPDDVFIGRTTYINIQPFPLSLHFDDITQKHPMSPQHVNNDLIQWLVL